MLTSRHPSSIQPQQLSPILLARLFGLARHFTEMLIVAFFTTACTVLMAALPLPQFLCSRWARPGGDLGVTAAVGAPSSAASSPTRHPCSIALRLGITPDTQSLARPHIRSSRNQTCESAPFPQNADTRQWGRVQAAVEEKVGRAIVFSRSHHRHYRRRCHHPFLFFQLHFSPSNLLFYITFALLLSFGSSASPSKDNGANSHLKASGQANVNHDRDITHYEARNASAPSGTTSSADSSPSVIDEYVCGDIDIRNSVSQFYKLENCTVVEGHVQIVLIDNGTAKDFANLTFPKLREITDYFLLFRIMGLQSLSKLFPNLSVIRGRSLVHNYALVIYEMLHLQDIGLISLTTIMRGDVRIEKNPNLCFVDTVDWTRIARNYLITGNKDPSACPNCNDSCSLVSARRNDGKIIGDSTNRVCWTGEVCQQYSCPSRCELANQTCSPTGDCCPQQCLGGCTSSRSSPGAPLEQTCLTCRNYIYKKRCYKECPSGTYVYFDRRCITKKQCYNLSNPDNEIYLKAFQNKCEPTCPVGYTENAKDRHQCDHCGGDCPKVCQSSVVLNVQGAQSLKGCTKINGSLEISISSGGDQIVKELEENLKDLTEITDYLKIARSFPLITLNFLRNLKVIHGNRLERQAYSLLVLDNSNLQDLWTLDNKQLRIVNGRPFVHINPKLCLSKINKMRQYIEFGAPQGDEWSENDVSRTTNGDKVPCEVALLGLSLWGIEAEVVGLSFENYKLKMEDHRTLLGYLIYYREAEHRNVSIFDGRDACSNNEWTVIEYDDVDGDPKNQTQHQHIIPNLKPFTQYALYIKTYTLDIATKGAQSQIIYFKTKPFTPSQPRNLFAKALKHNTIEIRWDLPSKPNGEIDHYNVRVTRDQLMVNHRDYCTESFVSKEHRVMPTPKPAMTEPIVNVWTNTTSSANDSFPWRNKDNKQCCTCKNEKIRPSDVEQSINFEDYIINTVYIKRTVVQMNNTEQEETEAETAAISKRRKRNISSETFFETTTEPSFIFTTEMFTENSTFALSGNISSSSTTMNTLETTTAAPVAPEKFVKLVRNFLRRSTFGDLYHFTEYTIEVQACQQETVNPNSNPCSMTAITSVRTLPLEGADDINQRTIAFAFDNSTMESKFKLIHIRWDEPLKPNGFILSYYIEYKRITNDPSKQPYPVVCVSRSLYEQHNSGYFLELPSGNYSVRIRARSLADYGNWTEPVYIFVDEPIADSTIYIVTISIVASVILVFVFCAYKWYLKRVKLDYISVNPEYMSAGLVYHPDPKWEVPREHITLIRELGQGSFGMVYEGEMVNEKKEMMKCAVKTVNEGSSIRERVDFLKEADVMKSFTDCHHVVKLLGIVSKDTPVYVLMEIMPRGDLRKYLRDNRPENEENLESKPPSLAQLYKIAIEIADGMAYLASKKYVHRDLAARNCMVADDLTVKIGDFGMTRDIYETDYYRKGGKGLLPVRWMSPESLKDGIFTTYSDVWSYGIVLWEMATLASQPYQGLSNEEVLKFVVDGGRMSKPENCPEVLWNLMCKTWERKAKSRPTFLKIVEMLLEHIDEKPFLAVSYYSQWKNDKSSHQSPEAFVEEEEDGKDESLIPLKALSASADSDTDDSGSSSSAELGEEDINVKFFPLSRNVASEVKLFEEEAKEDEREPSPREDRAMTGASDGKKSVSLIRLHELTEKSAGPNGGEGAAKGTKLLPANSHLSTSLANNNSASHCSSASTSNVNLDASTNNKESVITSAVFAGFEDAKLNQPPKEAPLNAASGRNLINGHLINTSMV